MHATLRSGRRLRTMIAVAVAAAVGALLLLEGLPVHILHAAGTLDQGGCPPSDYSSPALERLRAEQQRHYEAFGKFPDVIEVGSAVWEDVWEWHVRVLRQSPPLLATGDHRYALQFRGTLVVLRGDAPPNYFGLPTDRS